MKKQLAVLVTLFLIPCGDLFAAGNQITASTQVPLNDTVQLVATDSLGAPVAATWSVSAGVGTVDSGIATWHRLATNDTTVGSTFLPWSTWFRAR